ncbi:hypothetical protein BDV98DRAFT_638227, partial [Pterulicium gracile]
MHITLQPSPCYHTSLSLPSLSYLLHCAFAPPVLHSCSVLTCSRLIQQPPFTPSSYKLPYHIVPSRSWTQSSSNCPIATPRLSSCISSSLQRDINAESNKQN